RDATRRRRRPPVEPALDGRARDIPGRVPRGLRQGHRRDRGLGEQARRRVRKEIRQEGREIGPRRVQGEVRGVPGEPRRALGQGALRQGAGAEVGGMSADSSEERVLGEDGRFHAVDEEVRLAVYAAEDWFTLAVFWALAFVVFYQVFTRYVMNDAAGWT